MSGFLTTNNEHLIRSQLWSTQLKEALEAELMGTKYVDWVTEFTDGDQINIPSIGTMEVLDYVEGTPIRYTAMDTGNYVFTIDKYVSSATYITDKMKQDSYLAERLISKFVPAESRAIAVHMEVDMFAKFNAGQTASNANTINGAAHRWVASGTNETLTVNDFAKARFALQKANVPMTNLVAIVDPSFEYALNTLSTITALQYNPKWEGIINTGVSTTGMRFIVNIYGFDVYVSQYLQPTRQSTQVVVHVLQLRV